jgi:hypothetical protein
MDDDYNGGNDNIYNERAIDYIKFVNIIQHYDDTARPAHDDIDFEPGDYDSAEYDDHGESVIQYGIIYLQFDSGDDDYDDPYEYLYNRLRGNCKRPRGFKFYFKPTDNPSDDYDDTEW